MGERTSGARVHVGPPHLDRSIDVEDVARTTEGKEAL